MQPCQGDAVNSNAFYGRAFREPRRGGNSDFALTIWCTESATVCFVISLNVCECVCVRERERQGHITVESAVLSSRGLCSNTFEHHHCVCHVTLFPSRLELMLKLTTLLTVFTLILKAETHDYGKRRYISNVACGVRPITMHRVSWPIRAGCGCQKEGLCRKLNVRERRGIEDLQ